MKNIIPTIHLNNGEYTGKVFCKLKHELTNNPLDNCSKCTYLFGSMQGMGIECQWDDVRLEGVKSDVQDMYVQDPVKEFKRVSKLIKEGILKKG